MTVQVGIIGAGGIANKLHLPQLTELPDVRVTRLSGRSEHRLKILAERFRVPHWSHDYHDILLDPQIEAVVVALPHPLHVPVAIEVLAAGKHVLVQKPLCDTMEDAERFVEAVVRSRQVVFCLPHFSPAVYAARQLVRDGAIGKVSGATARSSHGGPEVYYAEVRDTFQEQSDDLWFFDASRASVGALFDMGVYATSQLIATMGSVARVFGRTATLDKPTSLEDTATLLLEFENGALGTMETSWCDPARTGFLHLHGTRGKLTSPGHAENPLTHWTPGSYTREDIPPVPRAVDVSPYDVGHAHGHFLDCVKERRPPPLSNAYTARHVTEVLLAGLESARSGRMVEIRSRLEPHSPAPPEKVKGELT
ncbi:MAG TPA: Gfo/Idh/MocA family oxidoreductase [Chloroflexota bacterium]|nr:Gfo/Idh/MocA family oxidoreductase [Chloroflexota bacterium]